MKVLSVSSKFSDHPEEKLITISRIKDAECPFKYYKNYIEKPRPIIIFESIERGIGKFFHSYVEKHFKKILAQKASIKREHQVDISNVISSFKISFIWEGELRHPYRIVRNRYSLKDFIERLSSICENFNTALKKYLIGHKVVDTEGKIQIRTDTFFIRGKYDLITKSPTDDLILWDWKTGLMPRSENFDDFKIQKIQLGIYAIWLKHKYELKKVKALAVFLRDRLECLSETFQHEIENDVLHYMSKWREQLNELTSYPAIPNNLCDWCGWNPICPAYQNASEQKSDDEHDTSYLYRKNKSEKTIKLKMNRTNTPTYAETDWSRYLSYSSSKPTERSVFDWIWLMIGFFIFVVVPLCLRNC